MHGNRRLCSFLACLNESSGRVIVVTLSSATASASGLDVSCKVYFGNVPTDQSIN